MGYNIYKEMAKFKQHIKDKRGNLKNIKKDEFGVELMLYFGMTKKTAMSWFSNLETVGIIEIKGDKVNFQ